MTVKSTIARLLGLHTPAEMESVRDARVFADVSMKAWRGQADRAEVLVENYRRAASDQAASIVRLREEIARLNEELARLQRLRDERGRFVRKAA